MPAHLLVAVIAAMSMQPLLGQPPGDGKMSFKIPEMSEEEEQSQAMPDSDELRCDACAVSALNFGGSLLYSESLRSRPLKEFQLDAALEQVCNGGLDDYGTTMVEEKRRYKGPGTVSRPGVVQGGGAWHARLVSACKRMLADVTEEEIYSSYKKHVPAPTKGAVEADSSLEGIQAFVKSLCLQKGGGNNKKKKKSKRRSTQEIQNSCPQDVFWNVDGEGWSDVLSHRQKEQAKVEL
eukprot:TRINITY_DN47678_c0_g1_i1.p1 TRINITY_DN47678_c0_g1~~TRINITY_DN47678_c0_g1_i1.p1  ORF type:complete len:254 (-),score=44.08 TRINITY_DN47678_c0_g1_i1:285-992(-)